MEDLVTPESNIGEDSVQLMKFHGSYASNTPVASLPNTRSLVTHVNSSATSKITGRSVALVRASRTSS